MNEYVIVGLIALALIIACIVCFTSSDKYVYDPNYGGVLEPNFEDKPTYKAFFESSDVNTENSVTNANYAMNCQNCNTNQTGFFKPLSPRNCTLCTSFVNGQKRKMVRYSGVL